MKLASREAVRRLALRDQTVAAGLAAQSAPSSGISWEEMLTSMVRDLVEDKAALQALLAERDSRAR